MIKGSMALTGGLTVTVRTFDMTARGFLWNKGKTDWLMCSTYRGQNLKTTPQILLKIHLGE